MNICVVNKVSESFSKTYVHRHLFAPGSALSKMEIYSNMRKFCCMLLHGNRSRVVAKSEPGSDCNIIFSNNRRLP